MKTMGQVEENNEFVTASAFEGCTNFQDTNKHSIDFNDFNFNHSKDSIIPCTDTWVLNKDKSPIVKLFATLPKKKGSYVINDLHFDGMSTSFKSTVDLTSLKS